MPILSVYEFFQLFPDEPAAYSYSETRRWPNGPECPFCHSTRNSRQRDYRYLRCKDCRSRFSVRTRTVFESSHIPLHKWLYLAYISHTDRSGINSVQLAREIGISQKSAWFMLHRLREACTPDLDSPDFPALSGVVEIDETYIGGKVTNWPNHRRKRYHHTHGPYAKQVVFGMRQRGGPVIAFPVPEVNRKTLFPYILRYVARGSIVFTDEAGVYVPLRDFYSHFSVRHSIRQWVNGPVNTASIETVWNVIKRKYRDHNWWSHKHSHRYINEAVFRLNEGRPDEATLTVVDRMLSGAVGKRLKYRELIE